MTENVILDNDLFIILAGADLLEDWLVACNISSENVYVLPTLPLILRRGRGQLCRSHCNHVIEVAKLQVSRYKVLPVIENERLAYFENIDGVDIGEQYIYAHLLSDNFIFAGTNDKKSINAVCRQKSVAQRLGKKIVCMEQCLSALIQYKGWGEINDKIAKLIEFESSEGKRIDLRLSCVFSQITPSESSTCEALRSFMNSLAEQCGDVLYPEWQSLGHSE